MLDEKDIAGRLGEIESTGDPALRTLRLAKLLQELFAERGSRIVVVGGSAIELLTDGMYASGDLDVCFEAMRPPIRVVAEVMAQIGAVGGLRTFRKGKIFIDILGTVETAARTDFREIDGVLVAKPEDLIAERILMATYPQPNEASRVCAEKLLAVAIAGALPVDWAEAERVADMPEYRVLREMQAMREDVAAKLGKDLA